METDLKEVLLAFAMEVLAVWFRWSKFGIIYYVASIFLILTIYLLLLLYHLVELFTLNYIRVYGTCFNCASENNFCTSFWYLDS